MKKNAQSLIETSLIIVLVFAVAIVAVRSLGGGTKGVWDKSSPLSNALSQ